MNARFLLRLQIWLAAIIIVGAHGPVEAMFRRPQPTPIDRLLKTAEEYVAAHPKSAEGHYTLARIHYLAFHLMDDTIPAFPSRDSDPPALAPQWMVGNPNPEAQGKSMSPGDRMAHATKARAEFSVALKLEPDNALYQLGMASLDEEVLTAAGKASDALPSELSGISLTKIREEYAKALSSALEKDSALKARPLSGLESLVSWEAASALVRLADKNGGALTDDESKTVNNAKSALEHFQSLPRGPMTPIVFSFELVSHLDELLAPEKVVDFDLRGYGPRDRWPWIKPELGLLVWDPNHTGKIESARQLFGGYSFEIFRANGYDALAALDDNGDGVLSGSELDGICVWFDRNGDGVSTPDEVIPVRDLGIESIAVTMDGYDGIHPTNSRGIILRDGSTLRTWDWIAQPLPQQRISQKERAF